MDFLAVTQEAAIAAYPWIGKGNKINADGAGTEAMRNRMNLIEMEGLIVIGEGEMDEAPMLHINEILGTGKGEQVDIAVDPIEGTKYLVKRAGKIRCLLLPLQKGGVYCTHQTCICISLLSVQKEKVTSTSENP